MIALSPKKSNHNAIAVVTVLSLMGPISGLLMEMVLAWGYGSSSSIDALRVSTLILGFGAQFLSLYLLPHLLIPVFSEYKSRFEEKKWWGLCFTVVVVVSLVVSLFAIYVFNSPWYIVDLLGPGLKGGGGYKDAQLLVRYFSIVLILMAWCGVLISILNSYRIFWIGSLLQIIPNIAVILWVIFNFNKLDIEILGKSTLIGYFAMATILLIAVYGVAKKNGINLRRDIKISKINELFSILKRALPLILVILIGQWGIVEINRALSELSGGTLSNFGFAWKLLAITSIMPVGIGAVLLPAFSDVYSRDDVSGLRDLAKSAFRMTAYLTMPMALFLFIEKNEIVQLLFGGKNMGVGALEGTALIFGFLVIGAPASAIALTMSKIAVVINDKFTLVGISILVSIITGFLSSSVGNAWGENGLAIMCTILAWLGLFIQFSYQAMRYKIIGLKESINYLLGMGAICIICALGLKLFNSIIDFTGIVGLTIN